MRTIRTLSFPLLAMFALSAQTPAPEVTAAQQPDPPAAASGDRRVTLAIETGLLGRAVPPALGAAAPLVIRAASVTPAASVTRRAGRSADGGRRGW